MKFTLSAQTPENESARVLVAPIWENGHTTAQQVKLNVSGLNELVIQTEKEEKFTGALDTFLFLPMRNGLPYHRILLVGLGKQKDLDPERVRRFAATAIKSAETVSAKKIVFDLSYFAKLDLEHIVHALVEGVELGAYKFLKYKSKTALEKMQITPVEEVILCGLEKRRFKKLEQVISIGKLFARATILSRDLINTPAGDMTPKALLEKAQEIAKNNPRVSMTFFNREQARKKGLNAFLGIAAGSAQEPYFVHLTYRPKINKKNKTIAIVGKGVTFDSGGLSLKPIDGMFDMKIDMSGAANVLAVFSVLGELEPTVQIEGVFTACENMPSGSAIKPGDVVTAYNGKTIEVTNTDAEGRVCLADSLSYTSELKPDYMVDFATLTGAMMVALGENYSGAFSNDTKFLQKFFESSKHEGEMVWELPLIQEYKKKLRSAIADINNYPDNKWGGAITAALFLQEFVDETIPWIHFDIAGPAGVLKQCNDLPYISHGGSGYGVRSFLHFVLKNF